MAMSLECASEIFVARHKLVELWLKALDENDDTAAADAKGKLDKLRPYGADADAVVIAASDAAFMAEAKKLAPFTKQVNDAIADFKKINDALKAAGDLINNIFKLLGALPAL